MFIVFSDNESVEWLHWTIAKARLLAIIPASKCSIEGNYKFGGENTFTTKLVRTYILCTDKGWCTVQL